MDLHDRSESSNALARHSSSDSPKRTLSGASGNAPKEENVAKTRRGFNVEEAVITAFIAVLVATFVSFSWKYIYPNQDTILDCKVELSNVNPPQGDRCLVWQFDLQPAKEWRFANNEAWSYVNLEIRGLQHLDQAPDNAFDLSNMTKVRFYIRGDRELGQLDEFNLFIGSTYLQYRFLDIPVSTRWSAIEIDLLQMEVAPWARERFDEGFEKPDLTHAIAFGFAVRSKGQRKQGTFALDDIVLVDSNGIEVPVEGFEIPQLAELKSKNVLGRPACWIWGAAALR